MGATQRALSWFNPAPHISWSKPTPLGIGADGDHHNLSLGACQWQCMSAGSAHASRQLALAAAEPTPVPC